MSKVFCGKSASYIVPALIVLIVVAILSYSLFTRQKVTNITEINPHPSVQIGSEDEAVAALKKRIDNKNPKQEKYWEESNCVLYISSDPDIDYYQVEIREKHSEEEGCPGDPQTMPSLALFHVFKDGGKIRQYDLINDSFSDY